MRNFSCFLAALAMACANAQGVPARVEANIFTLFQNGPTDHSLMLYGRTVNGTLRNYPRYNDTPEPGWETGELKIINLKEDLWFNGTEKMDLPTNMTAISVSIKMKATVNDGLVAAWNSLPAYSQADVAIGRPSDLQRAMSRSTFIDYTQNHVGHVETQMYVPVGTAERRVVFSSAVVPVEKDANGNPTVAILWSYGLINKDYPTSGNARGEVELAVYINGYYTPRVMPAAKTGAN